MIKPYTTYPELLRMQTQRERELELLRYYRNLAAEPKPLSKVEHLQLQLTELRAAIKQAYLGGPYNSHVTALYDLTLIQQEIKKTI